jgi:hypothetical protein
LSLETIFSWIMIDSSADDLCKYDSNWYLIWFSWLIQDNFRNLSADDRQRTRQRQDLRVLYRSRITKSKESQYYVKNDNR